MMYGAKYLHGKIEVKLGSREELKNEGYAIGKTSYMAKKHAEAEEQFRCRKKLLALNVLTSDEAREPATLIVQFRHLSMSTDQYLENLEKIRKKEACYVLRC